MRGIITFTQAPSSYSICLYRLDENGHATGVPTCGYFREPDYELSVRSGRYLVTFSPSERYVTQVYGLEPGDRRVDFGRRVTVTEGGVAVVDFRAEAYPVISGRVSGPDGGPVPDGTVRVSVETGGPEEDGFWNDGVFVTNSTYRVQADRPGRHVVRFFDDASYLSYLQPERGSTYATQYWPASWSAIDAGRLDLRWGQSVAGVDVRLSAGGHISGRLIDPRRRPAKAVGLQLERRTTAGWRPYPIDAGAGFGAYGTRGVPPGTYRYRINGFGVYEDGYSTSVVVPSRGASVTHDVMLTVKPRPRVEVERRPRLAGVARAGRTLRVTAGAYSPRRATTRYRWYADGRRLRACGAKLVVAPRFRGARIRVEVSAQAPSFRTRTVTLRRRVAR
ncbi:hypothetical protein ABFT23_08360 [Nocardioides sp. C4-1]|uniref:hypothetical protein n=1 Tax=Nocardioides sp. C4-1 TaxID=3151851 RepID=UPI00326580D5